MKFSLPRRQAVLRFIGSNKFFVIVVCLFSFQALWIALTARYPQAFDEQFHFGLIKIYAHHLNPFLSQQPANADSFGAVARDPSYLYHYLFSFPYQVIAHFTASMAIQVIMLRILNIVLFVASLIIFRKLLRFTKTSDASINMVLLFLVLLPVFPLLGAHINYDSLTILLSALAILWLLKLLDELRQQQRWNWARVLQLLAICIFGSLVKYPFLPIFASTGLIVVWCWLQNRRQAIDAISLKSAVQLKYLGYGLAIVIGLGLMGQRYGVNLIRYHMLAPECDEVLTVDRCQAYAPWARNYMYENYQVHLGLHNYLTYPFVWVYHMMGELVFTISSRFDGLNIVQYDQAKQLISIELVSWIIFSTGLIACIWKRKQLLRIPYAKPLLFSSGFYTLALFAQNFLDYIRIGFPVAIHGRYIFPVLPLLFLFIALAVREAFHSLVRLKNKRSLGKLSLASAVTLVLLLQGGGFATYIVRSKDSWFWPQSQPAQKLNHYAQKVLKPITLDIKGKSK